MTAQHSKAAKQMLSVHLKDKNALYAAYMPFLNHGGLFVPTTDGYSLGDEVFVLVTLPEESERVPVAGKVVWITPRGAVGNRTPGIGVHFNGNDGGRLRNKIEALLAGALNRDKPTHTL